MSPDDVKNISDVLVSAHGNQSYDWWPILIAVATGFALSFLPSFLLEKYRDSKLSTRVKLSLTAEVAALLEIAKRRKYQESIKQVIAHLEQQPKGTKFSFSAKIPDHYSRIFQNNCDQIGAIDKESAQKIIQFHQLVDAVVQDIKPGGLVSEGASLEAFKELDDIFSQAVQVGNELLQKL